jgi:1,5-anhydro-D-fructose reductase (1,5-anhydro-D-mannitol-forming)
MTTPSASSSGLPGSGLPGSGLRWALIGASDIAATKVLPAIRAVGGEAVVVRSGSAQLAQTYAQEHAIAAFTTDLAEAVGRDDVDAVYVSSVNRLHLEQVVAAAAAGKHVLAEKPLALSVADARAMVEACRAAGVVMATNHHLPASPTHIALRKAVADGLVGEVRAIRVHHAVQLPERLAGWRLNDPEGGGAVLDVTVHDAAAVAAILGTDAISVTAQAGNQDNAHDGPADAVMTTATWQPRTPGAPAVLVQTHDAYNNAHLPTSLHILGTEGALVGEDCNTGDPVGTVTLWRGGKGESLDVGPRENLYERTVRAFTVAVRGEGDVLVSGENGVASLAFALAVLESLRTGVRVPVQR